jgi:hypothetical protein
MDKIRLMGFWLSRLQMEFSEICYGHGVELAPPVFEISTSTTQLGCWQSSTRSLKLSEHLIASYPWSTTLQVLKHEMAHQYCSEVMGGGAAHGDDFKNACALLGVLPEFRGCRVITTELLQDVLLRDKSQDKTSQVLQKIEKLLALGESPNIHEAEAALKKATLLIEKYQLEQLCRLGDAEYRVVVIETGKKQVATYKRYIIGILQDFFYVRVVLSQAYVPMSNGLQKTFELMGTSENTAIAEYCYYFLENQLELMWKRVRKRMAGGGRTKKNSYYLGVVLGFSQKLKEQQSTTVDTGHSQQNELLVLADQRLNNFVQMYFPRLKRSHSRRSRVDSAMYQKGVEEGRKLSLSEGVTKGRSVIRGFLE